MYHEDFSGYIIIEPFLVEVGRDDIVEKLEKGKETIRFEVFKSIKPWLVVRIYNEPTNWDKIRKTMSKILLLRKIEEHRDYKINKKNNPKRGGVNGQTL